MTYLKDIPTLFASEKANELKILRDELQYRMGRRMKTISHYFDDNKADLHVVFHKKTYTIEIKELEK